MGSPGHNVATKLRLDLITDLGVECTCALLRVVTRHGRLHPGIAPKVEGPIVNSEASDYTPKDELKRMLEERWEGAVAVLVEGSALKLYALRKGQALIYDRPLPAFNASTHPLYAFAHDSAGPETMRTFLSTFLVYVRTQAWGSS